MSQRPPCELSYTLLKVFPCMWRLQWLLAVGRDQEETPASSFGRNAHYGAAKYAHRLIARKAESDYWFMDKKIIPELIKLYPEGADGIEYCMDIIKQGFTLDKTAEGHIVETRLAVDRDYNPCEVTTKHDTFAGTADYIKLYNGGTLAEITDYKFGISRWAGDPKESAQNDKQLQCYAWLVSKHYPKVETVTGVLWFVRWGVKNRLWGTWHREQLDDLVRQPEPGWIGLDAAWAEVDRQWEQYGAEGWDCEPKTDVCRWCSLATACPAAEEAQNHVRSAA